jgi:hypothetical protein
MKNTRFDDGRNAIGYRRVIESNRTPRFRRDETGDKVTERVMEREGFSIFESCLGRPMSKNPVLEGLSVRRLADIHDETSAVNCTFEKRNISTELVRRDINEKLSVISVQMVIYRRFRDVAI